jgi:hypothetical protein
MGLDGANIGIDWPKGEEACFWAMGCALAALGRVSARMVQWLQFLK